MKVTREASLTGRAVRCVLAGAAVAVAMAVINLTARHKALAAQAAAGHESTAAIQVTGVIVMTLLLGAVFFLGACAAARVRRAGRERQVSPGPGRARP